MNADVQWLTPSPLWGEQSVTADPTTFRRPAILRFATDTFMPELQSVLQGPTPQDLKTYVAAGENWENPAVGLGATTSFPLKLYQPVQARFYLVSASLTCRMPGLPDHTVNKKVGESVALVVRQLRPNPSAPAGDPSVYDPAKFNEYAWIAAPGINGAPGTVGDQPEWTQASPATLVTGEEQLPLSPSKTGSNGTARRILTGLIPASRRQQYIAARTVGNGNGNGGASTGAAPLDPRADMFCRQVVTPWCLLEDWWNHLDTPPPLVPPTTALLALYTQNAQQSSALILADFANFLKLWIPDVWTAIQNNSNSGLTTTEAALYNLLGAPLRQAISNAYQFDSQFETAGTGTPFPPTGYPLFSLTDPGNATIVTTLLAAVTAALPPLSTVSQPPAQQPLAQKPSDPMGNYWFIVRCVYLRPQCGYNVVSPPSRPFQMASYFDSDAPARRIQVALPLDTSAAALRKYDKGASFLLSPELQNQMARVTSLLGLSNGNIASPGGFSIGMICSFSIPIITICAMILLFVILIALNIVFFWMPFFKICLPVPGLKGKS